MKTPSKERVGDCVSNMIPGISEVEIVSYDGALGRLDRKDRSVFTIIADKKIPYHVIIGNSLENFAKASDLFERTFPEICVKTLGTSNVDGYDIRLTEHFDGVDFERAIQTGLIDLETAQSIAQRAYSRLNDSIEVSSLTALELEFEELLACLSVNRIFSPYDLEIISNRIFEPLKEEMVTSGLNRVVSNGDFIARNIIVSGSGDYRIIDYEFAARSHFTWELPFRWKKYSKLDPFADLCELFDADLDLTPWKEACSCLRQICLDTEATGVAANTVRISKAVERTRQLVLENDSAIKRSVFWKGLDATPVRVKSDSVTAQLFWSWDGKFKESNSIRKDIPKGKKVTFSTKLDVEKGKYLYLRFDGSEEPSHIEIFGVQIHNDKKEVLYKTTNEDDWLNYNFWGTSSQIGSSASSLSILSLGHDPSLIIPKVIPELLSGCDYVTVTLECVIYRDFSRALAALNGNLNTVPVEYSKRIAEESRIRSLLVLKEKEISSLKEKIKTAEGGLEKLISSRDELYNELLAKNGKINTLAERQKSLDNEIERLNDVIRASQKNIDRLNKQISQLECSNQEIVGEYEAKLNLCDERCNKQQIEISKYEEKLAGVERELGRVESKRNELQHFLESERVSNSGLLERNTSLTDSVAEMKRLHEALEAKATGESNKLQQELEDAKATLCQYREETAVLKSNSRGLEERLEVECSALQNALSSVIQKYEKSELRNAQRLDLEREKLTDVRDKLQYVLEATGRRGKSAYDRACGKEKGPSSLAKILKRLFKSDEGKGEES